MERIPEPELMEDEEQALAYAHADFEDAHSRFIEVFNEHFGSHEMSGYVLDLGCGPGDITFRFARAYPNCRLHGVDGSEAMLRAGKLILANYQDVESRVALVQGFLPDADLPRPAYDAIISNSLLHHLHAPEVLWRTVHRYAEPGAPIFIMDLKRPDTKEEARELVETYSGDEPEVLKKDFYNSLLAAFEPKEIQDQLEETGLGHLSIRQISDRHITISGYR
jgi:SAM-dependent methyltransferase